MNESKYRVGQLITGREISQYDTLLRLKDEWDKPAFASPVFDESRAWVREMIDYLQPYLDMKFIIYSEKDVKHG